MQPISSIIGLIKSQAQCQECSNKEKKGRTQRLAVNRLRSCKGVDGLHYITYRVYYVL